MSFKFRLTFEVIKFPANCEFALIEAMSSAGAKASITADTAEGLGKGLVDVEVVTGDGVVVNALTALTTAISAAQSVLSDDANLHEVSPDIADRSSLAAWLGIQQSSLQRYVSKSWWPPGMVNGKCWRVDDVVEALLLNTRVKIDNATSLIRAARAARVVNARLAAEKCCVSAEEVMSTLTPAKQRVSPVMRYLESR